MRLVSYTSEDVPAAGVLLGEEIVPFSSFERPPGASVRAVLGELDAQGLRRLGERAGEVRERVPLVAVQLSAPVPDPEKIICIGLNYRDHAEESGQEIPAAPMWFAKFANSLRGSGEPIVLPAAHPTYVDYEAELAQRRGVVGGEQLARGRRRSERDRRNERVADDDCGLRALL